MTPEETRSISDRVLSAGGAFVALPATYCFPEFDFERIRKQRWIV